ncbi:MAG: TetR family transcriptional regulator [Acidimicrobiaceae bacterium]|nr:TetR family transcriptional regulator [Acidimicrobiaceae bacterium]
MATHSEDFEKRRAPLDKAELRLLDGTAELDGEPLSLGKRERNKLHTLRAIYQSALYLFDRQGFDHTTVEDIAIGAGVTQRTLFNYFPTKESIVSFPLGYLGRSLSSLVRTADPKLSPLEALADGILSLFDEVSRTPSLSNALRLGYNVVNRTPSLGELNLARRSQLYMVAWKALLERGVDPDSQTLRAASSGIVACSLASMFSWLEADMSFSLTELTKSAFAIMSHDLYS